MRSAKARASRMDSSCAARSRAGARARAPGGGGALPADDRIDLHTRVQAKIHSLANSAAARATCRLAAAARRSQARRGAQPTQDAGLHPRPRLCPAHGRLATRVRRRRAVVEDVGVRPPDGGQAAADDARPRPPENTLPPSGGARHADGAKVKIPSSALEFGRGSLLRTTVPSTGYAPHNSRGFFCMHTASHANQHDRTFSRLTSRVPC